MDKIILSKLLQMQKKSCEQRIGEKTQKARRAGRANACMGRGRGRFPPVRNATQALVSALTRDDSREIFREAVFLW